MIAASSVHRTDCGFLKASNHDADLNLLLWGLSLNGPNTGPHLVVQIILKIPNNNSGQLPI